MIRTTTATSLVLMAILAVGIFATATRPTKALAATSFINVDISKTIDPNDQPFAINCDDPNSIYLTVYQMGMIAKVDKTTKAVSLIQHPEGPGMARGFYSMARDGSGNLWINELFGGRIWKYNPTANTWVSVPAFPKLTGPAISYPQTYASHPNVVRVDPNDGTGFHTFVYALDNYGDLIYNNGAIWMGLTYHMNFDAASHAVGVNDVAFTGLGKIDPNTNTLTQISITNSSVITGISVDSSNSSILWLTDPGKNAVFRFDTTTNTVTNTFTLPAASDPKEIVNDANNVYVALTMQSRGDGSDNSKIMQINKNTGTQTVIDTTAPRTHAGTFGLSLINGSLIWTDLSSHVGAVNLTSGAKTYTTTVSNDNHFGCQSGTEYMVAGHGSLKLLMIPLSDLSPTTAPVSSEQNADNQRAIQHLFYNPMQEALDNCKDIQVVESASHPYDYYHNGSRTYVEYVTFRDALTKQTNPKFMNLDELQQAWLFEKIKPQLDEKFSWISE